MTANKTKVTLRIKKEFNEKLKAEAQEKGISLNALLLIICKEFIEKQGGKKCYTKKLKINSISHHQWRMF